MEVCSGEAIYVKENGETFYQRNKVEPIMVLKDFSSLAKTPLSMNSSGSFNHNNV